MIIVLKATVELSIASMFESEPRLAREKNVNGMAQLVTAKTTTYFHMGGRSFKYFGCKRIGRNINEAIINLALTKAIGPNSGVPVLVNIKALPQIAPRNVNKTQYRNSIICCS